MRYAAMQAPMEPGHTTGELIFGLVMLGVLAAAGIVIFHIAPKVRAAIDVIRLASEDVQDEFDTQPRNAFDEHVDEALAHAAAEIVKAASDPFVEFEAEFADEKKIQRLAAQLEERAR